MNSKVGNSLAIVVAIVCSAWRAILPSYLGSLIYRSLRGGGLPQGVSAFCVAELDKEHSPLPPLPLGWVNIVLCTSVHSLGSAQLFWPGP